MAKDDKKKPAAKVIRKSKKDAYAVGKDGKLERKLRNCPKCGPGVFLANHPDRLACGRCGYTEFSKKK
ncbi:MAG TPA: 30S ribosomal protein S27ae [Methanomassiliicoccales archaeon]|nr:30S ribosomal protein S27ae [Methanomassiliicoccales archaeon]